MVLHAIALLSSCPVAVYLLSYSSHSTSRFIGDWQDVPTVILLDQLSKEKKKEKTTERERESVCVCVWCDMCVCVWCDMCVCVWCDMCVCVCVCVCCRQCRVFAGTLVVVLVVK